MDNLTKLVEEKVPVNQLIKGMYVANLDRPWTETPFPLQGVLIKKDEEIRKLAKYCRYVYIDREKSINIKNILATSGEGEGSQHNSTGFRQWKAKYCQETYKVTTSFKQELNTAKKVIDSVFTKVQSILTNRSHITPAQISDLTEIAHHMTESVLRNPDAMAWVCRIREFRSPIYLHGIRLSVWGCICGRQLGLNHAELHRLTTALMLSCIGKSFLSKNVLNQYSMTDCSKAYQRHLGLTLNSIESFKFSSNKCEKIIQNYCERIDGSGYPNGLVGPEIPFLSQVASLVETFELAINPYDMKKAISPANAIVQLNKLKGQTFDADLVEEFVKAIGIYPTGTIVQLNDARLGIISSQCYEKRLRASVIVVSGANQQKAPAQLIELGREAMKSMQDKPLCIKRGLSSNAIDKATLMDAHHHIFEKRSGFLSMLRNGTYS